MKYLYTITLLLISLQCFSQVMVESTGEFRYNKKKVTKEEAQDYALMDARRKAAQQVGVDVTQYEILSVKDNKQTYRLITNSQTNAVVQIIEQEFEYTKKCVIM